MSVKETDSTAKPTKCIQGIDKIPKVWYGSKSLTGERAAQTSERAAPRYGLIGHTYIIKPIIPQDR